MPADRLQGGNFEGAQPLPLLLLATMVSAVVLTAVSGAARHMSAETVGEPPYDKTSRRFTVSLKISDWKGLRLAGGMDFQVKS